MQEVLEKIIGKLDELIDCNPIDVYEKGKNCTASEAIEIVEQATKEFATDIDVRESGWVPVSERLPEESLQSVIGWDAYRERCVFVQYIGGRFVLGDDTESVKITHWMNTPNQPHICTNNDCTFNEEKDCPAAKGYAGYERKQTNADRIRSMSDEELAEFLTHAETLGYNDSSVSGKLEMIEWLQSGVEVWHEF